jgi:hypothetical protein
LPGSTLRLPVLIESKTIDSGTTNVTFSNLNGNNDELYLISFDLNIVVSSGRRFLRVQPNSDSATNYNSHRTIFGTANVSDSPDGSYMPICDTDGNYNTKNQGFAYLWAKTGEYRLLMSDSVFTSTAHSNRGTVSWMGNWKNSADNITSLKFIISGGSFGGKIKLYKMVDITIPD